jgi:hypothetical protein
MESIMDRAIQDTLITQVTATRTPLQQNGGLRKILEYICKNKTMSF